MIRKGSHKSEEYFGTQHRFEHWYVDNSVYFITARCRNQTHAFDDQECKAIFWDRFNHYTRKYEFVPFVTSLLSNHYHTLGYLKVGMNLGPMMKGIHGSVAKLVNDRLPQRCFHSGWIRGIKIISTDASGMKRNVGGPIGIP